MTRRDDLELSHGATAKVRGNAVKQDRVWVTNAIGHHPERSRFLRRTEFIGNYPTYLTCSFRIPIFKALEGRLEMAKKGPGRAYREGLTIVQLMDMFPTEEAAVAWFESVLWPEGERHCGKCGSMRTRAVPSAKPMPYWVHGLPGLFLGSHWHPSCPLECSDAQVGYCHLLVPDQLEIGFVDEAVS